MLLKLINKIIKMIPKVGPEIILREEIVAPLFLEKNSQVKTDEKT
jgi:hypothetical protein